jgi:hypothetical protein
MLVLLGNDFTKKWSKAAIRRDGRMGRRYGRKDQSFAVGNRHKIKLETSAG